MSMVCILKIVVNNLISGIWNFWKKRSFKKSFSLWIKLVKQLFLQREKKKSIYWKSDSTLNINFDSNTFLEHQNTTLKLGDLSNKYKNNFVTRKHLNLKPIRNKCECSHLRLECRHLSNMKQRKNMKSPTLGTSSFSFDCEKKYGDAGEKRSWFKWVAGYTWNKSAGYLWELIMSCPTNIYSFTGVNVYISWMYRRLLVLTKEHSSITIQLSYK